MFRICPSWTTFHKFKELENIYKETVIRQVKIKVRNKEIYKITAKK